ncbi:MAG TPA: BRCT domain-containing protein [Myxococcota bacterium]|nr:BRCT domain-containing protein [Myxococcota bacterium]
MGLIPDGTSFLFVGKLSSMTREQARAIVESQGGSCPSGLSHNLDYLVVGDENSPFYGGDKKPKQLKAEAMIESGARIAIISERDFLNLMGEQSANHAGSDLIHSSTNG